MFFFQFYVFWLNHTLIEMICNLHLWFSRFWMLCTECTASHEVFLPWFHICTELHVPELFLFFFFAWYVLLLEALDLMGSLRKSTNQSSGPVLTSRFPTKLPSETSQNSHSVIKWNSQIIQRNEQSGLSYPSCFQPILFCFICLNEYYVFFLLPRLSLGAAARLWKEAIR
jgi:hypothetical protein